MAHLVKAVSTVFALAVIVWASGRPAAAAGSEGIPLRSREAVTAAPGTGGEPVAPRLRLTWIDVLDTAPFAFPNAARAASAILASAGVEAEWTLGEASTVTTDDELKVVLMASAANGARLPERVMGGTRGGEQSRTTWVYFANVLWALGLQEGSRRGFTSAEEADIARALGRVVAHEIVHAVAPDLPHSRRGLMARTMGRALLLQVDVSLSAAEQRALRVGLAGFAAPAENPSFPVAALAAARR